MKTPLKFMTSKCCGTAVRTYGSVSKFAVCNHCNKVCDVVVKIDSGGGSFGHPNNPDFKIE